MSLMVVGPVRCFEALPSAIGCYACFIARDVMDNSLDFILWRESEAAAGSEAQEITARISYTGDCRGKLHFCTYKHKTGYTD